MLVLTRKAQEQIHIGPDITVTVVRVKGHSVRLGIDAPNNVRIVRGELAAAMAEFRDDETAQEGDLTDSELDEPAEETKRSADEEDESPTRGTRTKAMSSPLPSSRVPGDRACQLRRPPRLGPASFRRAVCG